MVDQLVCMSMVSASTTAIGYRTSPASYNSLSSSGIWLGSVIASFSCVGPWGFTHLCYTFGTYTALSRATKSVFAPTTL